MKAIFKKIAAFTLCLCMTAGFAACESNKTEELTTVNTADDDLINPVDISGIEVETSRSELENPNITYLGFYDMRIAADIKPAVKLFEDTFGGKIEYIPTSWGDRFDRLSTLIISGESPDLVDRDGSTFPHLMSMDMYEDLTDYIDMSLSQWAGMDDIIEGFSWKGARYYYPFVVIANTNWLMYNQSIFEDYGIDDPRALYQSGRWDWDAFKKAMVEFVGKSDLENAVGYYGLSGFDILNSTGVPLIGIENGRLVNNMRNSEIERATRFLEELRRDGLSFRGDGMWSNEPAPLADGRAAFLGAGEWRYAIFREEYPQFEFSVVPYPRDPNADKHYYSGSTFGYLVPRGSSNIEGAAEFINIVRMQMTDPDLIAVRKQSELTGIGYTEEDYDFLKRYQFHFYNYNMVNSITDGFTNNINEIIAEMLSNITFATGEDSSNWTQLRGEFEDMITVALEEYNNQ